MVYKEFDFLLNSLEPQESKIVRLSPMYGCYSEKITHLSYVFKFRSVWIAFLTLNVPAELETEFHDAIEYP